MSDGDIETVVEELLQQLNGTESLHQLLPEAQREDARRELLRVSEGLLRSGGAGEAPLRAAGAAEDEVTVAAQNVSSFQRLLEAAVSRDGQAERPALPIGARRVDTGWAQRPLPADSGRQAGKLALPKSSDLEQRNVAALALETAGPLTSSGSAGLAQSLAQNAASGEGPFSIATKVLTSGLGLAPLVRSIVSLFGGGEQELPPLKPFVAPPSIHLDRAINGATGEMSDVRYADDGLPSALRSATTINVNVSAMDSRSFLDHSNDIARAVREAMLNMHSINDVMSEL